MTVSHADTSTGVASNLDQLVPIVKKAGALFILDGVCSTAAMEEDMRKEYGDPNHRIDIILTGTQKAIGVPPGIAILAFSPEALAAREELGQIGAYYSDIKNWQPVMENPAKYFATPPVNLIYAYRRGLQLIMEEGLDKRIDRHAKSARAIRGRLILTVSRRWLTKKSQPLHSVALFIQTALTTQNSENPLQQKASLSQAPLLH